MDRDAIAARLTNAGLWAIWNAAFRPGYSPARMRRYLRFITAAENRLLGHRARAVESEHWNGVPVSVVSPGPEPERTLLYLHGGGYFMGDPSGYLGPAAGLSKRCNARVALVDYRLAPEHPHPAALHDAVAAYRALLRRTPAERIVVGGDSAGGGLVLALLLQLRDEGERLPARAFCISPWTDLLGTGASMETNRRRDVWLSKKHLDAWAPWYSGSCDPRAPLLSPVNGDYRGLPPLALLVGDQEVLLDDAVRVARRAEAAGVQVQLHLGRGMQHDWLLLVPWLAESRRAMEVLVAFIRG